MPNILMCRYVTIQLQKSIVIQQQQLLIRNCAQIHVMRARLLKYCHLEKQMFEHMLILKPRMETKEMIEQRQSAHVVSLLYLMKVMQPTCDFTLGKSQCRDTLYGIVLNPIEARIGSPTSYKKQL